MTGDDQLTAAQECMDMYKSLSKNGQKLMLQSIFMWMFLSLLIGIAIGFFL